MRSGSENRSVSAKFAEGSWKESSSAWNDSSVPRRIGGADPSRIKRFLPFSNMAPRLHLQAFREGSPLQSLRFHLLTLLAVLVTAAGAAFAATVPIGTNITLSVVPDPGTLALGVSGLVGLVMLGRRR